MILPQPFQEKSRLIPFPALSALRYVFICVLPGDSTGHLAPLWLRRGGKTWYKKSLGRTSPSHGGRKEQSFQSDIAETPFHLQSAAWQEATCVKGCASAATCVFMLQPISEWRATGSCFLLASAGLQGKLIKLLITRDL